MASFADVVRRQRQEGAGRTGALASAIGQKTLESIDPRKFLNQSGTLTALFPSLKTYQAKGTGDKSDKNLNKLATLQASGDAATKVSLEEMIVKLNDVTIYTRLSAKNSVVLPQMARDTNLIKQNIGRLLKVFGETQATKADMFFKGAAERESAIEAARRRSSTTPLKVETKKDDTGGFLATLFAPLIASLAPLIGKLTSFGSALSSLSGIGSILIGGLKLLASTVTALLSPIGLVVSGLAGLAALLGWLISKDSKKMMTPDATGNIPGGMTPDMSSVVTQNTDVVTTDDMVKNIKGLPQILDEQERARKALELGRKAAPDNSYDELERRRANRALNQTPPTTSGESPKVERVIETPSTSPVQVPSNDISEDLISYIKQKEGFSANAKWDFKQYSNGYGTKALSSDETITEQEADRRLREHLRETQKSVIDFGTKYGYNWNQKQIDALTSFAYNLGPGILKQLTADGTRDNDQIAQKMLEYNKVRDKGQLVEQVGLSLRRQQEFAMFTGSKEAPTTVLAAAPKAERKPEPRMVLASAASTAVPPAPTLTKPTPSSGPAVTTASASVSEGRMMLASMPTQAPTIIQDNSTKVQNSGQSTTVAPSAWDNLMLENIISRIA